MNINMQTIINVGLGIIVGFLVWQNDIQQDTIKTLMAYDEQDTDMSFDRIEALEEKLATVEKDLELYKGIVNKDVVKLLDVETKVIVNENYITAIFDNINANYEIANKNMNINEERIIENRKLIRDLADILRSN